MEEKYYGVDHKTRKVTYLGTPEDENFLDDFDFAGSAFIKADSEEEALQIYKSAYGIED